GGATPPPKAVALFQVEYPKRMVIGDTQLVIAHIKITNLFIPLSDESFISLYSPAFEIAPTQPQAIPQATSGKSANESHGYGDYFLDYALQWAVSPKTMGNQVLLLDIPQVVWNPKRAGEWWSKPRPLMEVNGVNISDFNKQRLELKIQVTTLFGLSE